MNITRFLAAIAALIFLGLIILGCAAAIVCLLPVAR